MDILTILLWGAGLIQTLIVASAFFTPGLLRYAENLRGAEPTVREIFYIHNWYVTLFVAAFAVACFAFPDDLAGASGLGRFFSAFLGVIWLLRAAIQLVYHNTEIKRSYPVMNLVFTLAFLYLGVVFLVAASGLMG